MSCGSWSKRIRLITVVRSLPVRNPMASAFRLSSADMRAKAPAVSMGLRSSRWMFSMRGDYAVYIWSGKTHKLAQSTFQTKSPALFTGQLLPGLETALRGKKMGSRVLAVIPPKDGYGKAGNSQAGVKGTDTLVFVVDMITKFGAKAGASGTQVSGGGGTLPTVTATTGSAPVVKIPSTGTPPTTLVTKTLIKGSGPAVSKDRK